MTRLAEVHISRGYAKDNRGCLAAEYETCFNICLANLSLKASFPFHLDLAHYLEAIGLQLRIYKVGLDRKGLPQLCG